MRSDRGAWFGASALYCHDFGQPSALHISSDRTRSVGWNTLCIMASESTERSWPENEQKKADQSGLLWYLEKTTRQKKNKTKQWCWYNIHCPAETPLTETERPRACRNLSSKPHRRGISINCRLYSIAFADSTTHKELLGIERST